MRYRESVGSTPSQPAAIPIAAGSDPTPGLEIGREIGASILHPLYATSNAPTYNLTQIEFETVFPSPEDVEFLTSLNPLYRNDYILAQACAHGHNHAWEHFLALYRQPLTRAAIAIAGNHGEDLADALYAELYGLTAKADENNIPIRKSPLASYKGRGSLIGWLRTTLAQRHIDHHRKTWREQPLEDPENPVAEPVGTMPEPATSEDTGLLSKAVQYTLANRTAEDRFLLAAYYLDQQTLLQIARLLRVHEATISRRLHRLIEDLRKDILRSLQSLGLSKRAAVEALGADPRDLDQLSSNLKKLLQTSQSDSFQEKAGQ